MLIRMLFQLCKGRNMFHSNAFAFMQFSLCALCAHHSVSTFFWYVVRCVAESSLGLRFVSQHSMLRIIPIAPLLRASNSAFRKAFVTRRLSSISGSRLTCHEPHRHCFHPPGGTCDCKRSLSMLRQAGRRVVQQACKCRFTASGKPNKPICMVVAAPAQSSRPVLRV